MNRDTNRKFPHLANAGKYALAHTVVLMGTMSENFSALNSGGADDASDVGGR